MNTDFRNRYYSNYSSFKGWDDQSTDQSEIYCFEIAKAQIKQDAHILEIGFGSADFMNWAKKQGYKTTGAEVSEELVLKAKQQGLNVHHKPIQEISSLALDTPADCIVLFDVLEHLTPSEILDFFTDCQKLLKPKGKILARFPNCSSPFGLQLQYADMTHVTPLSAERMRQVANLTGFELISATNPCRPLTIGRRPRWQRILLYKIRSITELFIGFIYFGGRVPLDPNLVVVLEKK